MIEPGTGSETAPAATDAPLSVEAAIAAYETEAPAHHSTEQPRAEDGTFTGDTTGASTEAEPAEDEPAAEVEPTPDPAAEPANEGDPDAAAPDPAEGDEGDTYVLKLPPRRPGEPEEEFELEGLDQAAKEAFNRLRNGFMRGEEYRERITPVEVREQELQEIYGELAEDPGTFLVEKVHPSMHEDVALALLNRLLDDSEAFERVVDQLDEWQTNPDRRSEWRQSREATRPPPEVRQNLFEIRDAVAALVPEGTDPAKAKEFQSEALTLLHSYVTTKRLERLDVAKVPQIIGAIAREHGFDAPAPAAKTATPAAGDTPADPAAPAPAPAKVEEARNHGRKLVQASARRREVTAVSPAGPGAAPLTGNNPPANQSIEERLEWFARS